MLERGRCTSQTALASGAAGAFIATREEIADSLAGVAIAISLVPPLCVVGIAGAHLHWGAPGSLQVQTLADSLADALGRPIVVSLRQIPSDVVRTASSRSPLP